MGMRRALLLLALVPATRAGADGGEVRLLTDDAIPRYLARGQELAKAEQWDKVVDVLQRVVVGDPSIFPDVKDEVLQSAVYSEDGRTYYPARELCLRELARLPPDGLRAYRDLHDATARQLMEAADATQEVEERLLAYGKVHDNYLPSSVGDDALERAGDLSLQLGRYYEALALYRRLLDLYPKDTDRDLPLVYTKAAYCAARIGDGDQLSLLLERLASEHAGAAVKVEGKQVPVADLAEHPLFRRASADVGADAEWPMPGGNPAHSRTSPDLPEDLPRKPFWTFRLDDRDSRLTAHLGTWIVFSPDREPSKPPQINVQARDHVAPYPTTSPVVQQGLVLYKDGRDIVARRIGSGMFKALVRVVIDQVTTPDDPAYRIALKDVRPGTQEASGKEPSVLEGAYQFLDYGAARLVATNGMIVVTDWVMPPNELRSEVRQPAQPNKLSSFSTETGGLIWAWEDTLSSATIRGDAGLFEAWQKDFQLHRAASFRGPGVVTGGIVYTVAQEREADEVGTVALWAVDVATGRVRYRTVLHYEDEVNGLIPRGSAIAVAGGTVYAVTQSGVVAAVDALPPGHVRWITRYARSYEQAQAGRGFRAGAIRECFAFNDPVVAEGKVIVMPADASEALALDAETGKVAWSLPRRALSHVSYVVGVRDGLLYVAGDFVAAIDVRKGEIVWSKQLVAGPCGRGFVGERYVHLPTHHANTRECMVERFDLKTGAAADPLTFEVDRLGNLLSIGGRLIAATGDEIMCFTTYEAELARVDAALGRPGADRAELYLERALLALAGTTRRRDQAREDFARALSESPPEKLDVLIRGYALDNLFAIAREGNDLKPLEEAEKIVAPLRAIRPAAADPGPHPYDAQIAYLRAAVLGWLNKGPEALAALETFVDQYGHMRVLREGRVVGARDAGGALRDELRAQSPAFAAAFAETVRGRVEAAVSRRDIAALKAILERYGDESPAEEARFALADLYEAAGQAADAEAELRDFVREHPQHARAANAHLRLARFLARQGKTALARRERFEGVSRLDDATRAENAALVDEVDRLLLPTAAARPHLRLPLSPAALTLEGAAPVQVDGGLPGDLALFASPSEFMAVEPGGTVRWRVPNPSRTGVPAGAESEPSTATVAGMIAAARFAARLDDDVLVGDVTGLVRVAAATGEVRWRYPPNDALAREQAQASLDLLRKDLRDAQAAGVQWRTHPLPSYLLADEVIVRVHPRAGVEAIHVKTGQVVWVGADTQGQVAVGPATAFGDLVVVGFASPGQVRVYRTSSDIPVRVWKPDRTRLLAPPLVDPMGRLVLVSATEPDGANGTLEITDVRGGGKRRTFKVSTANAAALYSDGKVLVYHDGSSGTENLHFLDLGTWQDRKCRGPDLMRSFYALAPPAAKTPDAPWLFVLTSNPGLEDEGARLFRIDPRASDVLAYDYTVRAAAFARPLLTEHHVAVAAILPRGAHVRLFDRDASKDSRGAQPLFVDPSGKQAAEMDFRAAGTTRLSTGIGLAAAGDGLVVGHPWGAVRLAPPATGG